MTNLEELREHCKEMMAVSRMPYAYIPASSIITLIDRIEKAEAELSAANEKLSKSVVLPDDGLDDCINMWPDNWRNDFDTGYNFGIWRCEQNIKAAGFTVEE